MASVERGRSDRGFSHSQGECSAKAWSLEWEDAIDTQWNLEKIEPSGGPYAFGGKRLKTIARSWPLGWSFAACMRRAERLCFIMS